jgi:hypothetical protein
MITVEPTVPRTAALLRRSSGNHAKFLQGIGSNFCTFLRITPLP